MPLNIWKSLLPVDFYNALSFAFAPRYQNRTQHFKSANSKLMQFNSLEAIDSLTLLWPGSGHASNMPQAYESMDHWTTTSWNPKRAEETTTGDYFEFEERSISVFRTHEAKCGLFCWFTADATNHILGSEALLVGITPCWKIFFAQTPSSLIWFDGDSLQ